MVSRDTIARAIQMARNYIIPALRYTLIEGVGESWEKWVANYVLYWAQEHVQRGDWCKKHPRMVYAGLANCTFGGQCRRVVVACQDSHRSIASLQHPGRMLSHFGVELRQDIDHVRQFQMA